jgi:low temperature requirement protein LtrA
MARIFRFKTIPTEASHRATAFEIFFDLVLVFGLTRIIALMSPAPTPLVLAQGLVLMLLLWWPFVAYSWLANQVRADMGLVRAGGLVVMAAIFVVAFVIPDVWLHNGQSVAAPLTVVVAYIVIRGVFLALAIQVSAEDRQLRVRLLRNIIPTVLAWVPLTLGLVFRGVPQVLLWAAGFILADVLGGWDVTRGFQVRSPSHLAERYGLVLTIALGESLISAGGGAASPITRKPVLLAALLALTIAVCLWWLYFENTASPSGKSLARETDQRRVRIANLAYALTHFLMIAGVLYLAVGIEEVIARVAHRPPGSFAGEPLDWTSTVTLYGGTVLYLVGRILFIRFSAPRSSPAQISTASIMLLLLPVARYLPALAAVSLLTAVLIALVGYERSRWQPMAAAR